MSIGNWRGCVAFTLQAEGGLVDDPNDPGGLTNFGISQRAYPGVDIRGLTAEAASNIYHRDYWERVAGDSLPMGVDLMVFDMAVNAGVAESARILQGCVGAAQDGVIGDGTLAAVATACASDNTMGLIDILANAQRAYYESLPEWPIYGAGWGARVTKRHGVARVMAWPSSPA